ncbi:hypothetical protein AB0F07_23875 [Streptomyces fructofermentans]|uniref:hypothetical protein n=1 Tax=Streptomyces fructofermentans TaxID=152141 RepID=UPI0033F24F9C
MSEYQHYQFEADTPLTDEQLAQIRALTTRASLTRHSFVNTYSWGDFKGDPRLLVETHYDAHLYFANWGTRRLILRWPATVLSLDTARTYCAAGSAEAWESNGYVVLAQESDPEDDIEDFNDLFGTDEDDLHEDGDRDEQWLPSIARARRQVAEGDLRLLYLAWLLRAHHGELDDDDLEPAVPPGLADLPEPLADLATFLRIDEDLITAAAEHAPPPARPTLADHQAGTAALGTQEKDTVLAQLGHDGDPHLLSGPRRRFLESRPPSRPAPRTVAELFAAVPVRKRLRIARQDQREAEERERAVRQALEAQDRRLADLQHDPETAWHRVGELISQRGTRHYPEIVRLLGDLAALADRDATTGAFAERYARFIAAHRTKKALLRDLRAGGPACTALIALTAAAD